MAEHPHPIDKIDCKHSTLVVLWDRKRFFAVTLVLKKHRIIRYFSSVA